MRSGGPPSSRSPMVRANLRLFLSWYEILGGVAATATTVIVHFVAGHTLSLNQWSATLAPFGIVMAAGIRLRNGSHRSEWLSIAVQGAQLFYWSFPSSSWKFCAGVFAPIWIEPNRSGAFLGLDASIVVNAANPKDPPVIGLNLAALVTIVLLVRLMRAGGGAGAN